MEDERSPPQPSGHDRLELQRWRETQDAIDAAERGEVVPAEEVFAWLDTWGREGADAE